MTEVYGKIRFVTAEPLTSTDAWKLWDLGKFQSIGTCHYQLFTTIEIEVSDDLTDASTPLVMKLATEGIARNIITVSTREMIADIERTISRDVYLTSAEVWTNELPADATIWKNHRKSSPQELIERRRAQIDN